MFLLCLGISHRTASLALREPLAMDDAAALQALEELHARHPQCELAIVSTCNRTEFYLARPLHGHPRREELLAWLADRTGFSAESLEGAAYQHESRKAISHLFTVAAGMDSMVLGEYQITHQIKRAYDIARQADTCRSVLNRVFQSALACGKQVRTQTKIAEGRVSIASVAVEFARHLFEGFDDKTLLIVGAGKMASLAAQHFMRQGAARLIVANRSEPRARDLAEQLAGRAIGYDELDAALVEADIVVAVTGSCDPILTAERFRAIRRQRKRRPLFLFDLALPRDIEPEIGRFNDVYLYDLDALQKVVESTWQMRSEEMEAARRIIDEQAEQCYTQVQMGDLGQIIRRLRTHLHAIGELETQRLVAKLAVAEPSQIEALVNEHTQRLVNKILHTPLNQLTRESGTEAALLASALHRLFDLGLAEDIEPPESAPCSDKTAKAQVRPGGSTDVE